MGLWQAYRFWELMNYLIATSKGKKQIEMHTPIRRDTIKSEIGYGFVYLVHFSLHSVWSAIVPGAVGSTKPI